MTIPSKKIESIRGAIRLEDVIAARIPLRRSGKLFVGSCPWHRSRSGRSFVVYPERQSWRCWGCRIGGDVFAFFMGWGGMNFPSAVQLVAKFAGIELDGNPSDIVNEDFSARNELAQVEARIAEILDAEFLRIARELDRATRLKIRAGFRLDALASGAVPRFAGEEEFCWSALQCAAAALPPLDCEYCLLEFGKSSDRERFVMADASGREVIIDELLDQGYVSGDGGYRWEVAL